MFNSYEAKYKKAEEIITAMEKEKKELERDHQRDMNRQVLQHRDDFARIEANVATKIVEKTNDLKEKVSSLTSDKAILTEKVSMYEKAFENLGFDVKDMKEILNKLVDGLVSKNQIQLIGQNGK